MDIPKLASRPTAPLAIYLCFDGISLASWGEWHNIVNRPFSQDVKYIREIWASVAEKFSPFNVNITTERPAVPYHTAVIGGAGEWLGGWWSGYSMVSSFPGVSFVFSDCWFIGHADDAEICARAVAHECGHALSLEHQSGVAADGSFVEYNYGDCPARGSPCQYAPLMGDFENTKRSGWHIGTNAVGQAQNDFATLAAHLGWADQTAPQTVATAAPVVFTDNTFTTSGVIRQTSEANCWLLTAVAGRLNIELVLPEFGATLLGELELRTADNQTTIIKTDGAIDVAVAPGNYVVIVRSKGFNFGDVGSYTLRGTVGEVVTPPEVMLKLEGPGRARIVGPGQHTLLFGPIGQILHEQYGLYFTGDFHTGWLGRNEKWLRGIRHQLGNDWYHLAPSGSLAAWDGTATGRNSQLLVVLEPLHYYRPRLLFAGSPWDVANAYGLYVPPGYHHNELGGNEDWWLGDPHFHGNSWYFVKPDGIFWMWGGDGLTGTALGKLQPTAAAATLAGDLVTYGGHDFAILLTTDASGFRIYNRLQID